MLNVLVSYIKFDFRVHFKLIVCTLEQGAKGKILMLDRGGRREDSLSTVRITGNILVQFLLSNIILGYLTGSYSLYVYITWWALFAVKASNPPNLIFPAIHS